MAIDIRCTSCSRQMKVPERFAGKRGKCPACGAVIAVPAADSLQQAEDGYELAESPEEVVPAAAAAADHPALQGTAAAASPGGSRCTNCGQAMAPTALHCAACGYMPRTGGFAQLDSQRLGRDHAEQQLRQHRRAQLIKLGGAAGALLLIVAAVVWWVTGPGAEVHVVEVQPVRVVHAMHRLGTVEPYSLFTGSGDMSLGIKGTQSKSNPNPMIAETDLVYSLGGGDDLYVMQADTAGDHVLVVLDLKQSLMIERKQRSDQRLRFSEDSFAVQDASGNAVAARLLMSEFEQTRHEFDLGSATGDYRSLLPPGVMPASEQLERGAAGRVPAGEIRYAGPQGVDGSLTFTDIGAMSSMPGVTGLAANGALTWQSPQQIVLEYRYAGGLMTLDRPAGTRAWWGCDAFTRHEEFSPFHRHRVALLLPRPAAGGKLSLAYAGKPLTTFRVAKPQAATQSAAANTGSTPGTASQRPTSENDPLSYFTALSDARSKARGLVNMSHLQQLGVGLQLYLDQHGRWPDELEDLRSIMPALDGVLVNERTKESPGFIYEKPPRNAPAATTPVIWEMRDGQKDLAGSVLYADGHVEQATGGRR